MICDTQFWTIFVICATSQTPAKTIKSQGIDAVKANDHNPSHSLLKRLVSGLRLYQPGAAHRKFLGVGLT
ncbi:hypothetical protein [Kitasatospora sp. McL0602]|uniref:hypothetical protein n=1 Tax=Kitasatospora sp. McL0602 TaxID=3439530 RepID=UPI003F89A49B